MNSNKSFIVRQSLFFNLLVAAIFSSIFIGVIITIKDEEKFDTSDYIDFIAGLLVPAIGATYAAIRRAEVFRINEAGIFYRKKLITCWDRFIQARTEEDNPEESLDVKFSLYIKFYNTNTEIADMIRIRLSPTLDKSIEEIQTAIESFSSNKIG